MNTRDRKSAPGGDGDKRRAFSAAAASDSESLRAFIAALDHTALAMLDAHGFVIAWNAGAHQLTGYSDEDVQGRPLSFLYAAAAATRDLEAAARADRCNSERRLTTRSGAELEATVSLRAVRSPDGTLAGYNCIFTACAASNTAPGAPDDASMVPI